MATGGARCGSGPAWRSRAPQRAGALRNPVVIQLGVLGAFVIGSFYALNLSAPTLLMAGTDGTLFVSAI